MGNFKYSRKLLEDHSIDDFLCNVLSCENVTSTQVKAVRQIETLINLEENKESYEKGTLINKKKWDKDYKNDTDRLRLRKQIVNELFTRKRLKDDDKIKLGKGGALPLTDIQKGKEAFLIIGLPASGKSGVANILADSTGSVIIDSDYAKRKFPEYQSEKELGAHIVHKESSAILFGNENLIGFDTLLDLCNRGSYNIVIPKIGEDLFDVIDFVTTLKDVLRYKVHLVLVNLDRQKSARRAFERFNKTGRYVSLSYIFDGYSNEPTINYYRLKNYYHKLFVSFCEISTDVKWGDDFKIIDITENNPLYILS